MLNRVIFYVVTTLFLTGSCLSRSVDLELRMPASVFSPGSPFSLDLVIYNPGPELEDAEVFVALTLGTGDFWMYPTWCHYPSAIDWLTTTITGESEETVTILPEFSWPSGAGNISGAMFIAAVIRDGEMISNLAQYVFDCISTMPPNFVYIPRGTYYRGAPSDEPDLYYKDVPQHEVTLTHGFYMMTTEVTRQMWADLKAFQPTLPNDPSYIKISPTMQHPVQSITWYEAILYANLMSIRDGLSLCYFKDPDFVTPLDATNYMTPDCFCDFYTTGYRLPTEAEWEYACRAGTIGPFFTSEPYYHRSTYDTCYPMPILDGLNSIAWWCGNSEVDSDRIAHHVVTKRANPWGLYDMHGNVSEWCWDWFDWYSPDSQTDPTGPSSSDAKILRGGSYFMIAVYCRSAHRWYAIQSARDYFTGFRLVRTYDGWEPPPTPAPPTATPSSTPTPADAPTPFPLEFVYIDPGIFEQGSPETEPCRWDDEVQHQTTLTRAFVMMRTEVTQKMWADLKAAQPGLPDDESWYADSSTINHPVQHVQWIETLLFANLLSLVDGRTRCYYKNAAFSVPLDENNYDSSFDFYCNFLADGYRLPTEAEWEYACRAGTTGRFYFDEPEFSPLNCISCFPDPELPVLDDYANWCVNSGGSPLPVGTKIPNQWNLFDMAGNVNEWCWDRFGNYSADPVVDPTGPTYTSYRIFRGGGWLNSATACRSAYRYYAGPTLANGSIGFRLVRTAL